MFLGFLVTERGIEIDPAQTKAIQELPSPQSKNDVQHLTRKMVAMAYFIYQHTDHLKPFFNVTKKAKAFEWTVECKETFLAIKNYLVSPSILKSPQLGNLLCMYDAVSKLAVNAVLLKLGLNGSQLPVYYVGKAMLPADQNYTMLENMSLALQMASNKLRPYFQAYQVNVLTNVPLRAILPRLELSRRLIKWVVELSEFGL